MKRFIMASDIKSFLFSTGLISNDQFGFRPGHSTLDMLLLLSKQCMEVLNARHEIRAISLDISRAFTDPKDCPYYCLRLFVCLCVSVCLSVVHPSSAQVLQSILMKLGHMDHWGT